MLRFQQSSQPVGLVCQQNLVSVFRPTPDAVLATSLKTSGKKCMPDFGKLKNYSRLSASMKLEKRPIPLPMNGSQEPQVDVTEVLF